jgi:DNA-directed RNA polymerase specialized sigma24 family protein
MLANSSPKFVQGGVSAVRSCPANDTASGTSNRWTPLITRIQHNDTGSIDELYRSLDSLIGYFRRKIGADEAEDFYHTLILDVVRCIRSGMLRDPERLTGLSAQIAHRMVVDHAKHCARWRGFVDGEEVRQVSAAPSPEREIFCGEIRSVAASILRTFPVRDQTVLTRFYIQEESPLKIQAEMGLTETQFRLIKSRAKARFVALVQNRIRPKSDPGSRRCSKTA